jgi:hypothetical protein
MPIGRRGESVNRKINIFKESIRENNALATQGSRKSIDSSKHPRYQLLAAEQARHGLRVSPLVSRDPSHVIIIQPACD